MSCDGVLVLAYRCRLLNLANSGFTGPVDVLNSLTGLTYVFVAAAGTCRVRS